jgi:hypothetical protein
MNYTTIDHDTRLRFELSCNEYCIADKIYHLANNPANDSRWCYASRTTLGEMLGFTKPTVLTIIKTLVSKNLVEMHPQTKHLRTTKLWYNNFTVGKETLPVGNTTTGKETLPAGKETLPQIGKETLPPSNNNIFLEEESTSITKKEVFDDVDVALSDYQNLEKKEAAEPELHPAVQANRDALKAELQKENDPPVAPAPLPKSEQWAAAWMQVLDQMLQCDAAIESAAMNRKITVQACREYMGYFVRTQIANMKPDQRLDDALRHFTNWLPVRLLKERQEAQAAQKLEPPKGHIQTQRETTAKALETIKSQLANGTFQTIFDIPFETIYDNQPQPQC